MCVYFLSNDAHYFWVISIENVNVLCFHYGNDCVSILEV